MVAFKLNHIKKSWTNSWDVPLLLCRNINRHVFGKFFVLFVTDVIVVAILFRCEQSSNPDTQQQHWKESIQLQLIFFHACIISPLRAVTLTCLLLMFLCCFWKLLFFSLFSEVQCNTFTAYPFCAATTTTKSYTMHHL